MKIVHISTSIEGGAGKAAYRLHTALLKSGYESAFVCLGRESKGYKNIYFVEEIKASILQKVCNKLHLPITHAHRNYNSYKSLKGNFEIITFPKTDYEIEKLDVIKEADVIHLHWVGNFLNFNTFFRRLADKKIIWTLHDENPLQGVFHYRGDLLKNYDTFKDIEEDAKNTKVKALLFHKSIQFVCLCEWMSKRLDENNDLKEFSKIVLPNIFDKDDFDVIDKTMAKIELNVKSDKTTLLFIANNVKDYRKGFDLLISALSLIKHKDNYRLFVVGNCGVLENIEIEHINFNHVKNMKDLVKVYSASDVLIIPSREDNLPNTMVESFYCGTPVISFKVGGLLDYIVPNLTGCLVDKVDSQHLANTIEDFHGSKTGYDEKEIKKFAVQNFDLTTRLKDYINLYSKP